MNIAGYERFFGIALPPYYLLYPFPTFLINALLFYYYSRHSLLLLKINEVKFNLGQKSSIGSELVGTAGLLMGSGVAPNFTVYGYNILNVRRTYWLVNVIVNPSVFDEVEVNYLIVQS